jgi:riboflavin synthase
MFSGIIESLGTVVAVRPAPSELTAATRIEIDGGALLRDLPAGASVAVNGACLTLAQPASTAAAFDVIPETLSRTNLSRLAVGHRVNLERSLRLGDRIDGHFVQGHVDGLGVLRRIDRAGQEYKLWIDPPVRLMPCMIEKGSVALDGVSLTIVDLDGAGFSVALIPTTLERTTLGGRRPGDALNIETDVLARLVLRQVDEMLSGRARAGVTWQQLQAAGFFE